MSHDIKKKSVKELFRSAIPKHEFSKFFDDLAGTVGDAVSLKDTKLCTSLHAQHIPVPAKWASTAVYAAYLISVMCDDNLKVLTFNEDIFDVEFYIGICRQIAHVIRLKTSISKIVCATGPASKAYATILGDQHMIGGLPVIRPGDEQKLKESMIYGRADDMYVLFFTTLTNVTIEKMTRETQIRAGILVRALEINQTITEVTCNFDYMPADYIGDIIRVNKTIKKLTFSPKFYVEANGAQKIAQALQKNTTLSELELMDYNFRIHALKGENGVISKVHNLSEQQNTQPLSISSVIIISGCMENNKVCKTIMFDGNRVIGSDFRGAWAIARILKHNKVLATLSLHSTGISTNGALEIASGLRGNNTLTNLNLSMNSIYYEGAKAIVDALKFNKTLKELDLRDNNIGIENAKYIHVRLTYYNTKRRMSGADPLNIKLTGVNPLNIGLNRWQQKIPIALVHEKKHSNTEPVHSNHSNHSRDLEVAAKVPAIDRSKPEELWLQ